MNENYFEASGPTVSSSGLVVKTLVGILIAFMVAIPNLMQGDLFMAWLYNINSIIMRLIMSFVVSAVIGIIWFTLYNALRKDHGLVFNWLVYIATSIFAGLFLGNALIFAVMFIGYYANGSIDMNTVVIALQTAAVATFVAVIGGALALPRLKMDGMAIKFFKNVSIIIMFLALASGILWIVGMIFSIFGLDFILNLLYQTIYGLGPISLALSVLAILAAEFMFLIVLARSKYAIGREPKHMEFYYSIILVNAIIRIYVEIFKFVLKVIARNQRNN